LRKRTTLLLLLILVIGVITSQIHCPLLTIREQGTDVLIWMARPSKGIFSLQWMHSVELEQWRETFQITVDGKIHLIESRFKAFGAGVPDNGGKEFYSSDDWFVMKGFDRYFTHIPLGVSCYSDHRLLYNDKTYRLCDWVEDGSYVVLKREIVPLYTYVWLLITKGVGTWGN
jgi:hypothetical protein